MLGALQDPVTGVLAPVTTEPPDGAVVRSDSNGARRANPHQHLSGPRRIEVQRLDRQRFRLGVRPGSTDFAQHGVSRPALPRHGGTG